MNKLPEKLFQIPKQGTSEFYELSKYISSQQDSILAYFPWLTAEMISSFGVGRTLAFLEAYPSQRIPMAEFIRVFGNNEKFERIVLQNCADGLYLELQSSSGFFDSLRRHFVFRAIEQGLCNAQIAALSGSSIRSIQRARSLRSAKTGT